jgi:alcohol dehydrogenase, propanol-preferring
VTNSDAGNTGQPDGTMIAAVLHELGTPLAIERVATPQPGYGDLLIKVIACGVCHSDLHAVDGDWDPPPTLPLIPGHEVTGRVAALGPGVEGFSVGSLVGVPWMYSSCGRCDVCLAGMETICPAAESTGYSKPGGYAEYLVAPAAFVAVLPEAVDPVAIAPILCAGVTTYRGLKRTGARPGQWVAIVGIGGLGHLAVQYAVAMGLRVVAVDVAADKLDLAHSHGASVVINAANGDPVAAVHAAVGGVHGVVVAAVATRAFEQAIGMLRPAGTAVYLGMPGGAADEMRMSIGSLIYGELSVRGSSVGTRLDLQEAVGFAVNGLVGSTVRAVQLPEINDTLAAMRRGEIVGRAVLTFP